MRIADSSMQSLLARTMAQKRADVQGLQLAAASGRKYRLRSDAPAESAQAATRRAEKAELQAWQASLDCGRSWAVATESALSQAVDTLQRLHELTVASRDATLSAEDRTRLGAEVNSLLETCLQTANIKHGDSYLFGGTAAATPPVRAERDGSGRITNIAVSTPAGGQRRQLQVGPETVMPYGACAVDSAAGVFVRPDSSAPSGYSLDIFGTMLRLRDALQQGTVPAAETLDEISLGIESLTGRLVESGVEQNRFEALSTHYLRRDQDLTQELSDLADVDLASVLSDLARQETAMTAALQVAGRLSRLSLADYL